MELQLIEKTDRSVTIRVGDPDTTYVMPILDALDRDKDVKVVRYIDTHPDLEDPAIMVETYKGDPIAAVKRAADYVSGYFASVKIA
ncbi:MAG: hypothetical protein GX224_03065 [Thermoplasmatales archaeon]|nr:hypothetical protein [Thermoplasmatales archaeon]